MSGLNLFQRLNEIKKKVAYIRKDKAVETYKAVTHDAVTAETRAWFSEFGVMVIPRELCSVMVESGKTAKGTAINRFEAKYSILFINCDDPADREEVILSAHALDHGDKAPGKAVSYATKYAILKVLQIETGENEEGRQIQNMAPGDEVEPEELATLLTAIYKSENMDDLQAAYKTAYTRASKDREAQTSIIKAKDSRKAELVKK